MCTLYQLIKANESDVTLLAYVLRRIRIPGLKTISALIFVLLWMLFLSVDLTCVMPLLTVSHKASSLNSLAILVDMDCHMQSCEGSAGFSLALGC